MVKFLIEKGADVNIKNEEGNTPVDMAKEIGREEIIELLTK